MNARTNHDSNHGPHLDARTFGAAGDGKTDDTASIQNALDAAAAGNGTVVLPDGEYAVRGLRVHPHTGLVGNATWGYRSGGGSVLRLTDPNAACLIDITGAVGATLNGLSLDGNNLGDGVHGVYMGPFPDKKEEDSPRIERCHISRFTGDGVRLAPVWCFSIRGCEVIFNKGNALSVRGWDGFILDNWFSGNHGAGYAADDASASVTMTGNRIEWNRQGGIRIRGGSHYNITGNYIDRSGEAGIALLPRDTAPSFCITATGNVIYRSGKPEWTDDSCNSAHVRIEQAHGLVFTGNSMCVGQDDGGGRMSPVNGIILRALRNSVVTNNALHIGAIEKLILDLGGHDAATVIRDNPGSLFEDRGNSIWASGQL